LGIVKIAPKSDVAVLLICFVLTVVLDMVTAISVGIVLAAFLFMRRMAELTQTRLRLDSITEEGSQLVLPPGVILYEINGPLFFGAAQTAMSTLQASRADNFRVLVLDLGRVPTIDATGLAALENAVAGVLRRKKRVVIAGPLPQPHKIFDRVKLETKYAGLAIANSRHGALKLAGELASRGSETA
jgi:SulP family sulfate permease